MTTKEGPNLTNNPEKDNSIIEDKITTEKERKNNIFKYISENGEYLTKFINSSNNKIIFKLIISGVKQILYSNDYSYKELVKACPLFNIEDNLEGIDQLITESINNYGIDLSDDEYDENKKLLIIKFLINSKIKEIKIILKKVDLSEEELISSLIDKVNNLLNERKDIYGVKTFTQVKNELDKKKEKLCIKLNELEKRLDKIGNTFNKLKEINLLTNSNIIHDSEEVKLISDNLKNIENKEIKLRSAKNKTKKTGNKKNKISNNDIIFKLVYRASRDGDSAKEFHKRCDEIGPNLTLIQTDRNVKFGGFTNYGWEVPKEVGTLSSSEDGVQKPDNDSFCFSLTSKKIYLHNKDKEGSIFCCENYGPTFSENIFAVNDNMLSRGGYCGKVENSCFDGQEKDYEISGEQQNFNIIELEVFEIINI